jgi:hypothetical protein
MCQNYEVKKVVDAFVSKGFMFTAFDVTKFLRAGGSNIRHSDVNTAVKQMFRDGEIRGYLRETYDVGAPVAPFVYYHQNADLSHYVTDWIENNPDQDGMKNDDGTVSGVSSIAGVAQPVPSSYGTTASATSPAPAPVATSVKPMAVKGAKTTDKDGRLYISPLLVNQIGLKAHALVNIEIEKDKVVIKKPNGFASSVTLYVNADGRIRISSSMLNSISNGKTVGYVATCDRDTIVVSAV